MTNLQHIGKKDKVGEYDVLWTTIGEFTKAVKETGATKTFIEHRKEYITPAKKIIRIKS